MFFLEYWEWQKQYGNEIRIFLLNTVVTQLTEPLNQHKDQRLSYDNPLKSLFAKW